MNKNCKICGKESTSVCDKCNERICRKCSQLVIENQTDGIKVYHKVKCVPKKFRKEVKE